MQRQKSQWKLQHSQWPFYLSAVLWWSSTVQHTCILQHGGPRKPGKWCRTVDDLHKFTSFLCLFSFVCLVKIENVKIGSEKAISILVNIFQFLYFETFIFKFIFAVFDLVFCLNLFCNQTICNLLNQEGNRFSKFSQKDSKMLQCMMRNIFYKHGKWC